MKTRLIFKPQSLWEGWWTCWPENVNIVKFETFLWKSALWVWLCCARANSNCNITSKIFFSLNSFFHYLNLWQNCLEKHTVFHELLSLDIGLRTTAKANVGSEKNMSYPTLKDVVGKSMWDEKFSYFRKQISILKIVFIFLFQPRCLSS